MSIPKGVNIAMMPLLQNIPATSNEDWRLTTCPECGRECWYQTNNAEFLKKFCPEIIFLCTECAIKERRTN